MTNQLMKYTPTLFREIVAFGVMDLVWGVATLTLPHSALTQQQSAYISHIGVEVLGWVLVIKALAILYACFFTARYQVIQKMMIFGFLLWGTMAILATLSLINGRGTSIFGLTFFMFVLFRRWEVFSFVPPKAST